mgnify:FL=1
MDEKGEFCPSPENIDRVTHYLVDKIEKHVDDITITRKYQMDDADVVLISFGCSVRSSLSAIEILRKKGVKAGLLQLVTVWPMPEKEIRSRQLLPTVMMHMTTCFYIGESTVHPV